MSESSSPSTTVVSSQSFLNQQLEEIQAKYDETSDETKKARLAAQYNRTLEALDFLRLKLPKHKLESVEEEPEPEPKKKALKKVKGKLEEAPSQPTNDNSCSIM